MNKRDEWENSIVSEQPVFESKEEAIQYALQCYEKGDKFPEVFQEPDGGKFIAATMPATEILYREGYKVIAGFADMMRMYHESRQKKLAKSFDEIRAQENDGAVVQ